MIDDERTVKKDLILQYLGRFPFYKWAASFAGIDRSTLENWRNEDKDFSARCETAIAEGVAHYGKKATPDFILKNVDPETFKDKKEESVNISLKGLIEVSYDKENKTE